MKSIYLGLAIHNHQPVGNFPWVFEEAYRQAYLPMLDTIERYPMIRLSLHYSGCLVDWLQDNHPEFIQRLTTLARRGQIEIMGGGYYEPILPAIPDRDKMGQLNHMNEWVKATFGQPPRGMWLAERVWEPQLARFTAEAGLDWTVLDDTHFKMVGLRDEDLFGYYVTEEQGRALKVFGTSKYLRYVIPWGTVNEVIDYLRAEASEDGDKIAVMGDDGEKFGNWPGTYEHCWKKGWVERFFRALTKNSSWLHTITLGDYARQRPASGRVYLPTASYAEMMEWALPASSSYEYAQLTHQLESEGRQDILRYMRGGFWRNFLTKYPEINSMHKKMLWVHNKVWDQRRQTARQPAPSAAMASNPNMAGAPTPQPNAEALRELWQSQCNCPYWHGVFGGSYMTDIRAEMYRHMIAAENLVDNERHGVQPWVRHYVNDFDLDSQPELLVETDRMNAYFKLAKGGHIFEWDWRPTRYNLLSTIARRPEAYHETLRNYADAQVIADHVPATDGEGAKNIHEVVRTKELGLDKRLWYDWHERRMLIDHFLHPSTTLETYLQATYGEQGDFVNQPYECDIQEGQGEVVITLSRDGHVWCNSDWLPIHIEKKVLCQAGSDELRVDYNITNSSDQPATLWFGVESSFNLLGGGGNDAASYHIPSLQLNDQHLDSSGETASVTELSLLNRWLDTAVTITSQQAATLWRFPIESIGNSEGGFERVYQASSTLLHWKLSLAPQQSWQTTLKYCCRPVESVL